MRKQNEPKIKSVQVRALLIFRDIMKIQNKAFENIKKEINVLIDDRAKSKDLDLETAQFLQNVYFRQRTGNHEEKENKLLESIRDTTERAIKDAIKENRDDGIQKRILTMTKDGRLYRDPKNKFNYPMNEVGHRLEILNFLIEHENFIPTQVVADKIGSTYKVVTNAVGEINKIAQKRLGLPKTEKLIISKRGSGYKFNRFYAIEMEG